MAGVRGAVVLATSPGAVRVVGGLPLLVRAVLALRAAGVPDIAVFGHVDVTESRRLLERRGIAVRWLATPAAAAALSGLDPILLLPGDVLVDASGVAQAAACPGSALPGLLAELEGGRTPAEALPRAPRAETRRSGEGLFVPLDAEHPPARLETALLDRLAAHTAAGDSYLAALIDRRLSRPVTRLLLRWPVTPSQITLAGILVGLAGAVGLAAGSYAGRLAGVLALIASIVLDCVDGEIARARFEQSAAGARLDVIGDYVVNVAAFAGLGVGLARQGLPPAGVWAIAALVGGVAAAMVTVHGLFVRPALTRGGDLHWSGDAASLHGTPVATVIEKLASRDYTYLLLVFALLGRLEWFLYAAALGSWAFVVGILGYWGYWARRAVRSPGWGGIRRRRLELACLLAGVGLLAAMVWHLGLATLGRDLRTIGWGLGVILLVESLNVALNTWGWSLAFPVGERTVGAGRLLAARLAGDGVNYLTPSATVGGELLRIRLLGADVPRGLRWASVSVAKLGQTVAQAIFILLGLGLVLPRLLGTTPWVAWLGGGGAAVLVTVAFVWFLGRGLWTTLSGVARRLGLRGWLPSSWTAPGRDLDAALGRLGNGRLTGSLACFVGGWAVGAVEIYLILVWVGGSVDWQTALALETGSVLIDGILFFVPGKIGTQEGGKVVLFAALGLNPARGFTVGVVRRIRELTYAGLGLVALGWLSANPTFGPTFPASENPRTRAGALLRGPESS